MGNRPIKNPVVIAIEGVNSLLLLKSETDRHSEFKDIDLWDYKEAQFDVITGIEALLQQRMFVQGLVKSVGIICDAEEDRIEAQRTIVRSMRHNHLPCATSEMTVARSADKPSTAYLIMPQGRNYGCIEDSCLEACKLNAEHVQCAESFFRCVTQHHKKKLPACWQAKLKVHALIAGSGDEPENTLGLSGCKGNIWDFSHPALKVMLDFVRMVRDA